MLVSGVCFNAVNTEPIIKPIIEAIEKQGGKFLEIIGLISLWEWIWEHPLVTLAVLCAFALLIGFSSLKK